MASGNSSSAQPRSALSEGWCRQWAGPGASWSPSAAPHFSSTFNMIDQRMERQRSRARAETSSPFKFEPVLHFSPDWIYTQTSLMWARQGEKPTTKKKKNHFFFPPFPHPHSALLHYITFNYFFRCCFFYYYYYCFFIFFFIYWYLLGYFGLQHSFTWARLFLKSHQTTPRFSSANFHARQGAKTKKRKIHPQGEQEKKSFLSRKEALKLHNESQIRFWAEQQCIIRGGGKGKTLLFKVCVFLRDGADVRTFPFPFPYFCT